MDREAKNVFAMLYVLPSDDWLTSKILHIFVPKGKLVDAGMNVAELESMFDIKSIGGDGNCLFRAVSFALTDSEDDHPKFRNEAVKLATEDDVLTHFITSEWIRSMRKPGEWGDTMAIQALCNAFGVCVRVLRVEDMRVKDALVQQMVWEPNNTVEKYKCVAVGGFTNMITLLLTGPDLGSHFEVLYPKNTE